MFLSSDKERVPTYTLPGGVSTFFRFGHSAMGCYLDSTNLPNDKVLRCSLWFLPTEGAVHRGR